MSEQDPKTTTDRADDGYISKSYLCKNRGWFPTMIPKFLGKPDLLRPNPHYRKAPAMHLFAMARVRAVEATDAFRDALVRLQKRSKTAIASADRQRAKLLAEIDAMPIEVRVLGDYELLQESVDHYNARREEQFWDYDGHGPASTGSDRSFLARIQVNYARHVLTEYDTALEETVGRVGVLDAVKAIRSKVYGAIARAYPHLEEECRNQMIARGVQAQADHEYPEIFESYLYKKK